MKKISKIYTAIVFILLFAPIAVLVLFSFNSEESLFVFKGFSLRWYRTLFSDSSILDALKNSLLLAVCSSAVATVIGTAAAFGVHHMKKKWLKTAIMSTTNIPMMNPEIITGISMMFLFVFVGGMIGLQNKLNFFTMLIAHVTFCVPYVILNVLPKFKQMDKSLPEAALDLGCTPLQSFFKVQLPAIMPGVFTGMIMSFTMSLDDFVISYFTTGVDFQTLPVLIYSMTKKNVKPTIYALSTIIFVVIFVLLLVSNFQKNSEERLAIKKAREEKKKREAILKSQKTGKPLKVKKEHPIKPKRPKRSFNFTRLIAIIAVMVVILTVVLALIPYNDKTEVINVYNWGEYIAEGGIDEDGNKLYNTNEEFEIYCREELGKNVKVNYMTFASNEDMYAKLKSGAVSYDVIIPSDYMIARLVEEDLLQELDFDKIPNYYDKDNIGEEFRGLYYDPENKYSVPYTYGMVGVIYDANQVDEEDAADESWDLMWNEKYKGDIVQFNNSRDAFGTAMYKLGIDVNTSSETEWKKAFDALVEQRPLIKKLVMDEIFNMMESGEAAISAYYAGDYLTMYYNSCDVGKVDLQFYYPKDEAGNYNTNAFIDAMCVPKNAQNSELAMEYINFMLSEKAAIANAEYIYYASPHKVVYNNPDYQADMGDDYQVLYPEGFDFKEMYSKNCYKNLDAKTKTYYGDLWEKYAANTTTDGVDIQLRNRVIIELSVYGIAIAAVAIFVAVRKLKKRKSNI